MVEKAPAIQVSDKIQNYLHDKRLQSIIREINQDYLYWDKVKYKESTVAPEELWTVVKLDRILKSSRVSFGNYWFHITITDFISKLLHFFDMQIGGYMGAKNIIPEADKTRYLVSSIMEEAISSSQMEGAHTTHLRAKEMLRKEDKPLTRSEQMIVNNHLTIKYIVKNKSDKLTPESLSNIHKLIANKTLDNPEREGVFRESDDVRVINYMDGITVHDPPTHTEINALIADLCDFFNADATEKNFVHPIVKGIIIHFMIGWIHPFANGNGRTARALFYWYLLKEGYWLTEYLSISRIIKDTKSQYEKAYLYTENDDNDLSYFITYNLKVMKASFEALKQHIEKKQKNHYQTANFLRIPRVNERQAHLLKILEEHPSATFSVKEIKNKFQVSEYTARADLNGLVAMEWMEVVQVNKVKRNYIKSHKFSALMKKFMPAGN